VIKKNAKRIVYKENLEYIIIYFNKYI